MRSVVVRPDDVWGTPDLRGGDFAAKHALPRIVPAFVSRPLGVFCVDTTEQLLALTYDDGPHPEHTPRILDLLAERGKRATFFVLGRQVALHPEITARIVAEGHELALHGDDHQDLLTMNANEAFRRIRDAKARVEDVAQRRVRTYRPPYGRHTLTQALGIRALGLDLVIWSGDAVDWLHDDESAIAARSLAGVFPGAILLLHDDRGDPETAQPGERLPEFDRAEVLRQVLDGIGDRGFELATVSDLMRDHTSVRSFVRY
ncbi:polysaccharide deacetylase family protein [Microbacterium sp.]|uniref:polysaccharide deacetylase family protein n=1 Tax=Microbacterium sp. TaxID=51671 RepID=UPI002C1CBC83|nr:polysaccharide deacetylase family protein [Microbacterium sp.]HWL79083.1 polysaccharide deacetylase family protein [Microbacterium sp.]